MRFKKNNLALIKILFTISVVLLAGLSYFSYKKNIDLIERALLVNHTNIVELELENNLSFLKDAETSNRGYLLTKDTTFLEPYKSALINIPLSFKKLDSLLQNNAIQKKHLATLKTLSNFRLAILKNLIDSVNTVSDKTTLLQKSRIQMDQVRMHTSLMIHEQDRLLNIRTKSFNKAISVAPLITIWLAAIAIVLLLFSYQKIIKELRTSNTLQTELKSSNAILEKSNNELAQFAYVASHDLQEPLRKIQTFISRIADTEINLSPKGLDYFGRINKSAKRMQQLILDILTYSRTNNTEYKKETTDLANIVYAAKYQLEEIIQQKKASVTIETLPTLKVVKYQMEQVFLNLLSNALKFTKDGIKPKINIVAALKIATQITDFVAEENSNYYCIKVSDNGIGFNQAYEENIFKIFNRLNAKEAYDGNGIGLSIVKKIIDAHGGYIFASSKEGEGATFSIYLPV